MEKEIRNFTVLQEDQRLVQKANPLLTIGLENGLPLGACKLLDFYLSQIDMHDPDSREVTISKNKLMKILGLKYLDREILKYNLSKLRRTSLEFTVESEAEKGDIDLGLFEYSFLDENMDYVRLSCTPAAMKYVFNIESMGYLKYRFFSIKELRSIYSYNLFTYLGKNRFRKTWVESYRNLRKELGVPNDSHPEFRYFRKDILERAKKELSEKTLCRFSYETIKDGREVAAIRFSILSSGDFELLAGSIEKLTGLKDTGKKTRGQWIKSIRETVCADKIENEENKEILDMILNVITDIMLSESSRIKVGDVTLPVEVVRGKMMDLREENIRSVITSVENRRGEIIHPKAYIKTVLYHSVDDLKISGGKIAQEEPQKRNLIDLAIKRKNRKKRNTDN